MSVESNKAAVRRLVEVGWAQGNEPVMRELISPVVIDHAAFDGLPPGADGYVMTVNTYRAAFSELTPRFFEQLGEGDIVGTRVHIGAKHTGDGLGVPPTGKDVVFEMLLWDRFEDGLIVEEWAEFDTAKLMGQVGALG